MVLNCSHRDTLVDILITSGTSCLLQMYAWHPDALVSSNTSQCCRLYDDFTVRKK